MPMGVRSGINQALHDLSPIAGPEAEKRLLGGTTAGAGPAPADGAASDAGLEAMRKDVLDNVTGPIVAARTFFEATPPEYTKAFVAASQAEGALERIRGGSGRLPPEIQVALATRGPHIATVHLEALDFSGGDMPMGVRSGINQALHDLSPIAGPEAEKRLLGATAAEPPTPAEPPKLAPNPFD